MPATFGADAECHHAHQYYYGAAADTANTDDAAANGANAEATDADGIYTEPDYLQMVVGSA